MAPMVEAARDGRLDAREGASVTRHLATCAACQSLAAELARMAELAGGVPLPPKTPLEHQRGRVALLNQAALEAGALAPAPHRPSSRIVRLGALAVAASLALAAGGALFVRRDVGAQPALARTIPAAPRIAARLETRVLAVGEARFTRTHVGKLERVALEEGAINLEVRPLGPDERFVVATGDGEVEVRGTVFRVEAHEDRLVSVWVSEGKVEVRYAAGAKLEPGAAGLTARSADGAPAPIGATLLRAGQTWAPSSAPSSAPSEGPSVAPPAAVASAPVASAAVGPSAAPKAAAPTGAVARLQGQATHATAAANGAPAAPVETPAHASNKGGFAEAMRLIERGDYAAGADQLEAYRKANPKDARAEDAAYLSMIALQRAGRREDAAAAARRYLQQFPNGYRRAEAQAMAR
jgi:TolA-binding protein